MLQNAARPGDIRTILLLALTILLPLLGACATEDEEANSPAANMIRMATQMQTQGDSPGALNFYLRALQRDPANVTATRAGAAIFETMGDIPAAADLYAKITVAKPRDAALRREYGRLLLAAEQPAEARQQYEAALEIDPEDTKAMTGLGVALDYLGDHTAAQKQYAAVLQRDPGNLGTTNNLAYSSILSGDYAKAIALLEPVLRDPAATPALRQNLALAYGLAGMDADAARVAKMDLPPKQVKANLDYYKTKRAELKVSQTPYAELGTYPTEDMARAQIVKLQPALDSKAQLKPVVMPELSAPGGTPRFTVRMMGCNKPEEVSDLCKTLAPLGVPCVAHNDGR